jgi:hypothetical protein
MFFRQQKTQFDFFVSVFLKLEKTIFKHGFYKNQTQGFAFTGSNFLVEFVFPIHGCHRSVITR